MPNVLTWDEARERATAPDGVIYSLASEDTAGRHGGRAWDVYVYEQAGAGATRILTWNEEGWPTKARARTLAERDARKRHAQQEAARRAWSQALVWLFTEGPLTETPAELVFQANGPWILADKMTKPGERPARFAIWKATGAVHRVQEDGEPFPEAVEDDPIWKPAEDDVIWRPA